MKRLLCLSAGIVAMSVFCATAEQAAPPAVPAVTDAAKTVQKVEPKAKPELKEITVTGAVSQQEKKNKKGETMTVFVLTSDDGTVVNLPKTGKGKGGAPAFKLEDYVGAKVKVVGMGFERENKGKKMVGLQKITTIDKVAEVPPALPAK